MQQSEESPQVTIENNEIQNDQEQNEEVEEIQNIDDGSSKSKSISGQEEESDNNQSQSSSSFLEIDENILQIVETNKFFNKKDIVKYYDKFKEIDQDGSLKIDRSEMKEFLISFGIELDDNELQSLISEYDKDQDQTISFEEFLVLLELIMKGRQLVHQQTQNSEKKSSSSKVAAENQNEQIEVNDPIVIKEEQIHLEPLYPQVEPIRDKAFEFQKGISLQRLKAYVNDIHPREEIEIEVKKKQDLRKQKKKGRSSKFLEMVKVKDKIKFNCCLRNIGVLALGREPRQLTDVENEIGIGLTIYFRQLKLLMILFFLFTVFSLPQISLFYTASQESALDPNQDFLPFFVNNMWFRFTLGALGHSDFFCTSVPLNQLAENFFPGLIPNQTAKYDKNFNLIQNATYFPPAPNITKMQLNCPQAGIFNLVELGISQYDSRCPSNDIDSSVKQNLLLQTLNLDPDCSFRQLETNSSQFMSISQEFSKLYSLKKGTFGLNPKLMFTEACYNKTQGLIHIKKTLGDKTFQMNPQIFMIVQCLDTQFLNPINGKYNIDRTFILQIIIITDCLIVFLYVMIIIFMQRVSERAVNEFRSFQNQLETKDFAIIVSNLPSVKDYKNEQILKAMLIQHFEKVVNHQQQQILEMQNEQKYQNQIADVFFGKMNYGPFDKLMEIKNLYQQIFLQIVKSQNTQKSYFKSITQIKNQIEKQKAKYLQLQNAYYEKEQSSESLKNYLKQKGDGDIVNAFIVFRSMEGRERALAAYEQKNVSLNRQLFNMICFFLQCCKKEDDLLFMKKQEIIVEQASDPDHINWANISKQSKCRKCCEGFCTFLVSILLIFFIFGVLWGQQYFINQFQSTYPSYNILGNNPQYYKITTDKSAALLDLTNGTLVYQDQQKNQIIGLMTAYCDYMTQNKSNDPSQIFFDDENFHCYNIKIWRNVISLTNILVAFILVIWAYFSSFIFENCIGCMYSYVDTQHMYEFKTGMTLIVTFINSVVVLMLNHYDLQILPSLLKTNIDFLASILGFSNFNLYFIYQYLPILTGDYSDLTIGWYKDVGQTICWILTIWLIVTSIFKFGQLIIHSLKLYFDANCLFSKKFGTLMRTQFDLNNLYTGSEFNISYNYVTIHFFIWICMSFSTTMPILYSVTFTFLFFKYWIDKYLVLNYNRKTTTFNEQVPINQLKYLKWPIFLHVLCTFVTLSGNQMLFDTQVQNNINQNQSQQSNLNIPLQVNLGDSLKNLQASQMIDLNLVPKPQTIVSRFLQTHMILIYAFWIFNLLCYIFQEQIEKFFQKIGEILHGQSDENDEDSDEQEFHCRKCEQDKYEIEEKKKRVKALIQKTSKQIIHDNEKYNILSSEKKERRYADSSEDENQFKLEDFEDNEESFDQDHLKISSQTRHSDDFFREIRIDQLIQYYEKNDFEMQRTIHALSKNHLFNPQLKKGSDFVGTDFNQQNMKEMIGLLRRRRKTFTRRLTQIMAKMNPHIKQYFASPHEFDIPIIEDPFKDQVEILKQILIKNLDQYHQQQADEDHSEDLEVALSLECIDQKKILNELNKFPRIKQSAQSYDFLDQPHYQGVMSIYKMYIPELKTNIVIGNTKQISETQSQKSMEKTLQDENQNMDGDENYEIYAKQSSEKEGPLQSQKSIELQNLLEHKVDSSKQEDQN